MKTTRAAVEELAQSKGFEPIEIDGIPDGFAFKEPDITINGTEHIGRYVAFIPLREWDGENKVYAASTEELLKLYKAHK